MAMAAMAAGGDANPIGCTQVTEILNTAGVTYAGDLPEPYGLSTTYTAGISTQSRQADAAAALIEMLSASYSEALRVASGFS
jgi:molybdate transport system substrate-binding protein